MSIAENLSFESDELRDNSVKSEERLDLFLPLDDTSSKKAAKKRRKRQLILCLKMLFSDDANDNRMGIDLLELLTSYAFFHKEGTELPLASSIILTGQGPHPKIAALRGIFLRYLCHNDSFDDDDRSYYPGEGEGDDTSCSSDDEDEVEDFDSVMYSRDTYAMYHDGTSFSHVLHLRALKILAKVLQQQYTLIKQSKNNTSKSPIHFSDFVWGKIVSALARNIEMCSDNETSEVSLKCLRMLHKLNPFDVTPLLGQTLLPYLVHLQEYGKNNDSPKIEKEASRLLRRSQLGVF